MLCIVMDWYAGGDLSRKIKRRKRMLPPPPPPPAPLVLAPPPAPAAAAASALTTLNDHIAARASTAGSSSGGDAHALAAADPSTSSSMATAGPPSPPPAALFAEDVVLDWLVQLLLGLHHIHARRVLHRDLKTSNIFISLERPRPHHRRRRRCATPSSSSSTAAAAAAASGTGSGVEAAEAGGEEEECVEVLRIGDFGIAKIMDHGDAMAKTRIGTVRKMTQQHKRRGTTPEGHYLTHSFLCFFCSVVFQPYYLAPEVVGGSSYSLKADLWSCGCSLFQMLTGSHAFGAAKNLNSLVVAIVRISFTHTHCSRAPKTEANR
jgi:serine/threonine protein kinase